MRMQTWVGRLPSKIEIESKVYNSMKKGESESNRFMNCEICMFSSVV